jgi:tRNA(Ile)-lysidine synthase
VSDLPDHVRRTFLEHRWLERGTTVVVAVSGGLDSMVLFDLMDTLARERKARLAVAHFNHQLRGAESDADEALVTRTAARRGWPCACERAAVARHAKAHGWSIEMTARALRHEFLARVARAHRARFVALAHHAGDQVETFFLRALRGAGAEGLGGMRLCGASPADAAVRLIRPLLAHPRQDLEAHARERALEFHQDSTNADRDVLRNRIRHGLLPLLRRRFQPGIDKAVLRAMALLQGESEVVENEAQRWLRKRVRPGFGRLPVAVQRRILYRQLLETGVAAGFDLVEQLRLRPTERVMTEPGRQVWAEGDGKVRSARARARPFREETTSVVLGVAAGTATLAGVRIDWRIGTFTSKSAGSPVRIRNTERFDADKVGATVTLRHWRPGDRFQPIGLPRAAKLQDLFTNLKVPAAQRRQRVVAATADGTIFWVEGLRIAEQFKLEPGTRRQLRWRWSRRLATEGMARC